MAHLFWLTHWPQELLQKVPCKLLNLFPCFWRLQHTSVFLYLCCDILIQTQLPGITFKAIWKNLFLVKTLFVDEPLCFYSSSRYDYFSSLIPHSHPFPSSQFSLLFFLSRDSLNIQVLQAFVRCHDLNKLGLVEALRWDICPRFHHKMSCFLLQYTLGFKWESLKIFKYIYSIRSSLSQIK